MKRHLYVILLLLTAYWAMVYSSENCCSTVFVQVADTASDGDERGTFTLITADKDCALPVQLQKIELNVVHLTAKQQFRRLAESVFGHDAECVSSCYTARWIIGSRTFLRSLETYNIGFPFSSFW